MMVDEVTPFQPSPARRSSALTIRTLAPDAASCSFIWASTGLSVAASSDDATSEADVATRVNVDGATGMESAHAAALTSTRRLARNKLDLFIELRSSGMDLSRWHPEAQRRWTSPARTAVCACCDMCWEGDLLDR